MKFLYSRVYEKLVTDTSHLTHFLKKLETTISAGGDARDSSLQSVEMPSSIFSLTTKYVWFPHLDFGGSKALFFTPTDQ